MNRIDRIVLARVGSRILLTITVIFGLVMMVESLDTTRLTYLTEHRRPAARGAVARDQRGAVDHPDAVGHGADRRHHRHPRPAGPARADRDQGIRPVDLEGDAGTGDRGRARQRPHRDLRRGRGRRRSTAPSTRARRATAAPSTPAAASGSSRASGDVQLRHRGGAWCSRAARCSTTSRSSSASGLDYDHDQDAGGPVARRRVGALDRRRPIAATRCRSWMATLSLPTETTIDDLRVRLAATEDLTFFELAAALGGQLRDPLLYSAVATRFLRLVDPAADAGRVAADCLRIYCGLSKNQ